MRKFFKPRRNGDTARYSLIDTGRWRFEFFHWASVPATTEFNRFDGGFELTIKLLPYLDVSLIKNH